MSIACGPLLHNLGVSGKYVIWPAVLNCTCAHRLGHPTFAHSLSWREQLQQLLLAHHPSLGLRKGQPCLGLPHTQGAPARCQLLLVGSSRRQLLAVRVLSYHLLLKRYRPLFVTCGLFVVCALGLILVLAVGLLCVPCACLISTSQFWRLVLDIMRVDARSTPRSAQ